MPGLNRRYLALVGFAFIAAFLYLTYTSNLLPRTHRTTDGPIQYVPSSYDWSKAKIYHPVEDIMSLPEGSPQNLPTVQSGKTGSSQDDRSRTRQAAVKKAFVKSWEAYKTHAWGDDELLPVSGKGKKSFGWSAQITDALDTLWIMDLKDDFNLAVREVARLDWGRPETDSLNLFEVTIRHLGGLLAAYDLSEEPTLLSKAIELADMLYLAYDTPNHLPPHYLDYTKAKKGTQVADDSMSGAAGGSMSLEFTRLSQITGNPKYYDATERVKKFFHRTQNSTRIPGLWPNLLNYRREIVDEAMFTMGSGTDSQIEYLPKMHAILGGLDPEYVEMTVWALETGIKNLLFRPITRKEENILMAGNAVLHTGDADLLPEMQHLTCFVGGTYALAGKLLTRKDFVDIGSRLTAGCVWLYDALPTNIAPEISELVSCDSIDGPCPFKQVARARGGLPESFSRIRDARYLLRPEAIESVFYMWRITRDEIWRDAAWRMWEAIVRETETELAFATITDVKTKGSEKEDSMETFWLSETIKYFYLIFSEDDVINLDDWVLNTEAHPLKRPKSPRRSRRKRRLH